MVPYLPKQSRRPVIVVEQLATNHIALIIKDFLTRLDSVNYREAAVAGLDPVNQFSGSSIQTTRFKSFAQNMRSDMPKAQYGEHRVYGCNENTRVLMKVPAGEQR